MQELFVTFQPNVQFLDFYGQKIKKMNFRNSGPVGTMTVCATDIKETAYNNATAITYIQI